VLLNRDFSNGVLLSEFLCPFASELNLLSGKVAQVDLSLFEFSDEVEVSTDQDEHHDVEESAAMAVFLVVSVLSLSVVSMSSASVMIFLIIFHVIILISSLVSSELLCNVALERQSSDDFHFVILIVIFVLLRFDSWWSIMMSSVATMSLMISVSSLLEGLKHLEEMRSNVITFCTKLAAIKDSWWKRSGVFDRVASWFDSCGIAPGAWF
jgi:hypothetical protein